MSPNSSVNFKWKTSNSKPLASAKMPQHLTAMYSSSYISWLKVDVSPKTTLGQNVPIFNLGDSCVSHVAYDCPLSSDLWSHPDPGGGGRGHPAGGYDPVHGMPPESGATVRHGPLDALLRQKANCKLKTATQGPRRCS